MDMEDYKIGGKMKLTKYEPKNLMTLLSSVGMPQDFQVMDEAKLQFINEQLPAFYREKEVWGRQNSQVTSKLMSLTMLKHGVFGALTQIGAQVEAKRNALKENTIKLAKVRNKVDRLNAQLAKETDQYKIKDIQLDIIKHEMNISDSRTAIEHALREVYMYLQTRKEIMESNNIPENFDEELYIEHEIKDNLQSAFQLALREVVQTGRIGQSSEEWLSQFGVHPLIGFGEVNKYLASITEDVDINHFYKWLDEMYDKYKDEWKKAAKRIGIQDIYTKECAYMEKKDA